MKVMYHRAVLDLIKRQRGIPLSAETMQIYTSYLGWKYVAETTKILILEEVYKRVLLGSKAADVVADVLVSYDLLLDSTNGVVRLWTSWIIAELASQSSTRGAVVAVKPCPRLVALLSDDHLRGFVDRLCFALSQISRDSDGARAVIEARALETVLSLLKSPEVGVRRWSSQILGELAVHPSTREAVLAVQPCAHLAALLGDRDLDDIEGACFALSQISRDLDGARGVLEAGALDLLQQLLKSPEAGVKWTSEILFRLALHRSRRGAVVAAQPYPPLVALLSDDNVGVVQSASDALSQISRELDSASTIAEAGAPATVERSHLRQSQYKKIRGYACWTLGWVVSHPSTRQAVVAIQPCARLVALLGDTNLDVITGACFALSQISNDLDSAKTIVKAGALNFVPDLIQSPEAIVRKYMCLLLARLAHHNRVPTLK
ncbi:armadillo-type protein [Mycena alexandri]|uniref:Armadillo-type protein n=1 Tax=Mycena alexandri TaxID=1745969 RepID=A0AAD6SVY0_9AGAR|nr:armadillo-type protein [Mycena alexandri]